MELPQRIFEKAREPAPEEQMQVLRYIEGLSADARSRSTPPPQSFDAAARRFIIDDPTAPRDLSVAKVHMEGFGRS